jgi:hypothetical protein
VHAEQAGLPRLLGRGHHGEVARGGGHDIADPVGHARVHGTEPSFLDGLVPGQDPGALAEHLAPGGQDVPRGAGPHVEVPGPRLAAEQGQPGAQFGRRVHVEPVLGTDIHHAVVGRHVQGSPGRQGVREVFGQLVDVRQLVIPGVGPDPERVPGAVEVAVVHGHERAPVLRDGRRGLRGERAHAVGGPELRAAQRGNRQALTAEGAPGHVNRGDARGRGALVERRQRLPLARIHPRIPAQAVEQPILAGDEDLVAEHPVLARGGARPDRGQAGDRRGREPGRDRLGIASELGQEGRGGGMVAEEFPAEPVHDQQARSGGGRKAQHVRHLRRSRLQGGKDRG